MRTELTEKFVRALDLADLDGKTEERFWDRAHDGLCLRVRARGDEIDRRYFVHYHFEGKEKRLAIGTISETTLADARNSAYEIRRSAKDGIDPREKRRPKPAQTLRTAVEAYLIHLKPRRSTSTYRQARLYLKGPYFAPLHATDIGKITQANVAARLRTIEQEHLGIINDGRNTAYAARSMLHRLYTWLNEEGLFPQAFYNPVKGTRPPADRKFKQSRRRKRFLNDAELLAVWNACGHNNERYGWIIRLIILTGCRRQEVGGMRKSELDLSNRIWTIPAERYKTGRPHTVYLASAAVEIIESACAAALGDGVFETGKVGKAGRPRLVAGFQDWSTYKPLLDERLGDTVAKWVLHDLRRTMRSGLGKLKVPVHVAEMAIGHAQPVIVDIYDQHDYVDETRDAFERWAEHVAQLTGDNVLEFRRA